MSIASGVFCGLFVFSAAVDARSEEVPVAPPPDKPVANPYEPKVESGTIILRKNPREPLVEPRVYLDGYEVLPEDFGRPLAMKGPGHTLVVRAVGQDGKPLRDDHVRTFAVREGEHEEKVPVPIKAWVRIEWLIASTVSAVFAGAFLGAAINNYTQRQTDWEVFTGLGVGSAVASIATAVPTFMPEIRWR